MAPVRSPLARTAGPLLLGLALLAAGCSGIAVRKAAKAPDLLEAWKASVLAGDELSPRSLQTLRLLDLEPLYRRRPAEAVAALHALALQEPQPDLLFALAEMSYLQGKRAEKWACATPSATITCGRLRLPLPLRLRRRRPGSARGRRSRRPTGAGRPLRPALPPGLRPVQRRPGQVHRRRPARRPARPAPAIAPADPRRRRLHAVGRRTPASPGSRRSSARCCSATTTRSRAWPTNTAATAWACRSSPSAPPTPPCRHTLLSRKRSVSRSPPSSASTAVWPTWASAAPAGWSCTIR